MRLKEIITDLEIIEQSGNLERQISQLVYDSRLVKPNSLFFALPGVETDGHIYISDAVSKGAVCVVYQGECLNKKSGVVYLKVADARKTMALLAGNFYLRPSKKLMLAGITGTDGKTTTAHILHSIFSRFGHTGLMGTVGHTIMGKHIPASRTTPESVEINKYLSEQVNGGGYAAIMEVSSHALELHRTDYLDFDIAVFTNLSQDHLDFHQDMETYFQAKAKLFRNLKPTASAVVNFDDTYGKRLRDISSCGVVGFSLCDKFAPVYGELISAGLEGIRMNVYYENDLLDFSSPLFGRPNAYNLLAAITAALRANCSAAEIRNAAAEFTGVKGRFERIDCGKFTAIVDYAHTEKAVANTGAVLRTLTKNKLYIVLGCGGNRDKKKRPLMARAAEACADKIFITTDNPRNENPVNIIDDMLAGLSEPEQAAVIVDRREAIYAALNLAKPGDIVGIFGKGHEDYQEINGKTLHFSDREVVEEYIKEFIR